MNCHFCNDESVITSATGICVVCTSPTCSRPSGRSDNRFHGDTCRYPRCNAFICEYDTHGHTSTGGHTPVLPLNFPALSLAIGLGALSAAESSLGNRDDSPIDDDSNRALSRYLSFTSPMWRNRAIAEEPSAVTSFVRQRNGQAVGVGQMEGEYFDSERVAYTTLTASVVLRMAWNALERQEQSDFGEQIPPDVILRIAEFSAAEVKARESHEQIIDSLSALSPRLAKFVFEATSRPGFGKFRDMLNFKIEDRRRVFTPSDEVRYMANNLALNQPVGMLKA
jgi:hypothetical protein